MDIDFWCDSSALSLGVWTDDEDLRLTNYVVAHAGSLWSGVPEASGLVKSYQSCRIRYMTHLCPPSMRLNNTEAEQILFIPLQDDCNRSDSYTTSDYINGIRSFLDIPLEDVEGCEPDISIGLNLPSDINELGDATCTETNKTNVGQTNSIGVQSMPKDATFIENKGVIEEDFLEKNGTMPNEDNGDKRDIDATCINNTNDGQSYHTIQPAAPQGELHVQNNSFEQKDSSDNIDFMRNGLCDDQDNDDRKHFDDGQNKYSTTPLDTTQISKKPSCRTSKISISREDIEQHFHMNVGDAATSLKVSRSKLKRECRANGIEKWPCCKRRKINHQQCSNLENVNKLVINNGDEKKQSIPMSEAKITSPFMGNKSSTSNTLIKARYEDDIITFRLSILSKVDEMKKNIGKRLDLDMQNFRVKYKDDYGDLVLITCDEDLHEFLGGNRFDIFVFPVAR